MDRRLDLRRQIRDNNKILSGIITKVYRGDKDYYHAIYNALYGSLFTEYFLKVTREKTKQNGKKYSVLNFLSVDALELYYITIKQIIFKYNSYKNTNDLINENGVDCIEKAFHKIVVGTATKNRTSFINNYDKTPEDHSICDRLTGVYKQASIKSYINESYTGPKTTNDKGEEREDYEELNFSIFQEISDKVTQKMLMKDHEIDNFYEVRDAEIEKELDIYVKNEIEKNKEIEKNIQNELAEYEDEADQETSYIDEDGNQIIGEYDIPDEFKPK